jgi:hypothetical protein
MQIQPQLILLQKTLLKCRGPGPPALSRARYLEDRAAGAARLDARAHEPAGVAWLALSTRMLWLGWLQMIAAVVLYLGSRSAKLHGE